MEASELADGLKAQGYNISQQELMQLMGRVDFDRNGTLDLEEFISGLIDWTEVGLRLALDQVWINNRSNVSRSRSSCSCKEQTLIRTVVLALKSSSRVSLTGVKRIAVCPQTRVKSQWKQTLSQHGSMQLLLCCCLQDVDLMRNALLWRQFQV